MGIGDIRVLSMVGGDCHESIIRNVLFVPDLCTNLLSLTKILDLGYTVFSNEREMQIFDGPGTIAIGKREEGLFKMNFIANEENLSAGFDGDLSVGRENSNAHLDARNLSMDGVKSLCTERSSFCEL